MAVSVQSCGICVFRHLTNPSVVWCWSCDYGLCENCREHHDLSRASRNHKHIPIEQYMKLPAYILAIKDNCEKHDKEFQSYCRKHNCPCCKVCVITEHGTCEDKVLLEEVIENVQNSYAFEETEELIGEMLETIKSICKDRDINSKCFIQEKENVHIEIQNVRCKINKHLDKIEADLLKEISVAEEKMTKSTNEMMNYLEKEKSKITEYQSILLSIKQYCSELQAFCALKQINSEANTTELYLQALVEGGRLERNHISVKISSVLQNALLSIKQFGEVVTESKPTEVRIHRRKDKQAQMLAAHIQPKSIDTIRKTFRRKINTKGKSVRGCLLLPNDTVVFSCYSSDNFIKIFKIDGSEMSHITTGTRIYDIAYIEDTNSIAVTSGKSGKKCVKIIDSKSNKVEKIIPVGSFSYGVALGKYGLYFCAQNQGLKVINLRNDYVSLVGTLPVPEDAYVATFEDKLYYTNFENNTVTCSDYKGQFEWQLQDDNVLRGPLGIDCDSEGNIYVVGNKGNNVVVISPDGNRCRQLLSDKDELDKPQVLHYDRSNNKLLVANKKDNAYVFDITN